MVRDGDNRLARVTRFWAHGDPRIDRRDLAIAAAVFGAAMLVYILTLAPTVTGEDSGELVAASYLTGVAHPPGYPLWCLATKPFFLIPVGDMAYRANLASAFFGAATALLLYLVARTWGCARVAAFAAALALAFSQRFWSQSVIAEVYTLNTALFVCVLLIVELWRARMADAASDVDRRGAARLLVAMGLVYGLSLTNHYMLMGLAAPGLVLPLLPHWRRLVGEWRTLLVAAGACAAGTLIYLYLPIAAATDPFVNWGDPDTWGRFWDHVLRRSYRSLEFSETVTSGTKLLFIGQLLYELWNQFTPWLLAPIVTGVVSVWKRDRTRALSGLGIVLLNTVVLIAILLRFTFERENRQRFEPYYLPAYCIAALWMAAGLTDIGRWLRAWIDRMASAADGRITRAARAFGPAAAIVAIALLPVLPLVRHFRENDRSTFWIARDYAAGILAGAEKDAVIFPCADFTTFPLIYLMGVEGMRPDVMLADKYGMVEAPAHELFRTLAPDATHATSEDIIRTIAAKSPRPVYVTSRSVVPPAAGTRLVPEGLLYRVRVGADAPARCGAWDSVTVRGLERSAGSSDAMERALAAAYRTMQAESLFAEGKHDEAVGMLECAARIVNDDHKALNNLGSISAEHGQKDLAARLFARAVRIWPPYVTPRLNLIGMAIDRGDVAAAAGDLAELERLAPDSPRLVPLRARLELARGESAPVAANDAVGHNDRGTSLALAGRPHEAAVEWRKAITLDPAYALPHKNLAVYFSREGNDPAKSKQHEQEYERLSAKRVSEPRPKLDDLQRQSAASPDDPVLHNNLGSALAEAGRVDEAVAHWKKALALKPDYASARRNLAAYYAAQTTPGDAPPGLPGPPRPPDPFGPPVPQVPGPPTVPMPPVPQVPRPQIP